MLIGILGAGEVALAFSRYALRAGHQVRLSNSRGPESLKDVVKELGTGASAGTIREAAQAPIVLIAIPWPKVEEVLKSLPDKWENRILIDATNHFLLPSMEMADLKGQVSSEIVQGLVPGARVVKALNNLRMSKFQAGPRVGQSRRIAFVSGDDSNAKQEVGSLIREFGFAVIDLGSLHDGGRMQQLEGPLAGLDLAQIDD